MNGYQPLMLSLDGYVPSRNKGLLSLLLAVPSVERTTALEKWYAAEDTAWPQILACSHLFLHELTPNMGPLHSI